MRDEDYERLQKLELFVTQYASVIDTALRVYSENMNAQAVPLENEYIFIKDDTEKRAAQDKTWVTTDGLKHMAGLLRESADQAGRARAALTKLEEEDED